MPIQRAWSFDVFCLVVIGLLFGHRPDVRCLPFRGDSSPSCPKIRPFFPTKSENRILMQTKQLRLQIHFDCLRLLHILCFFGFSRRSNFQRSAITSALKSLSKPWTYLSFPDTYQKSRGEQKQWKPESKCTRTDLSRDHKKRTRCNSKIFTKISQSSPFRESTDRRWGDKDSTHLQPPMISFLRLLSPTRTNEGSDCFSAIALSTVHT